MLWSRSVLKIHAKRAHALLLASDVVLVSGVFAALLLTPGGMIRATEEASSATGWLLSAALLTAVVWPITLRGLGLYGSQRRRPVLEILFRLLLAAIPPTVLLAVALYAARVPVTPLFAITCGLGQALALGLSRSVIFTTLRLIRRRGRNFRNLLVVGSGPLAKRVEETVQSHPEWGLRIVGFVDETDDPVDPMLTGARIYKLSNFPQLMTSQIVDEVIIACPRSMLASVAPAVGFCAEVGTPITMLSDLFGDYLPAPRVVRMGGLPALSFAPVHHGRLQLAIKRGMDIIGAAVLLALFSPIIGVAGLIIRASSPGPAFFRSRRCGLHGRTFEMLKLRTMYADAEERKSELSLLNEMDGPVFKIRDDPRVTPVGRMLRRWSLDEVPQFWNVLKGEISLVGPRPPVPAEVEQYANFERRRLSMRPGITCLWQVSGRNSVAFDDWVKLDLEYIDTWTLSKDLEILCRTVPAVLRGTGAS